MATELETTSISTATSQQHASLDNITLPLFPDMGPLTASEQDFLNKWQHELPIEVWGSYLILWLRELGSYGTPPEFLDSLTVKPVEYQGYQCIHLATFPERLKLMQSLLEEFKFNPTDEMLKTANLTRHDLDNCGGCQSLEAVKARLEEGLTHTGVIAPHYDNLHIANAYPYEPGGSLLFTNKHADMTTRSLPITNSKEPSTIVYLLDPDGTFDAPLSEDFVLKAFSCANIYNAFAIRNHAVTGKSVANHDHFQFAPIDLKKGALLRFIADQPEYQHDFSGNVLYRKSKHNIFDTLIISSTNEFKLAKAVSELAIKLEKEGTPFVLAYYNGYCLIGPSREDFIYTKINLGARVLLHYFFGNELERIDEFFKLLPRPGEFNWEKYGLSPSD